VPHVVLSRVFKGEELLERLIDCDYSEFARNLPWLQTVWKDFVNRHGLQAC
jgi:hypothetical protein